MPLFQKHLALFCQLLQQDRLLLPYEMDLQISEMRTCRSMTWCLTVHNAIVCYSCVDVGADIETAETLQIRCYQALQISVSLGMCI